MLGCRAYPWLIAAQRCLAALSGCGADIIRLLSPYSSPVVWDVRMMRPTPLVDLSSADVAVMMGLELSLNSRATLAYYGAE
jgi:hypothetical protein